MPVHFYYMSRQYATSSADNCVSRSRRAMRRCGRSCCCTRFRLAQTSGSRSSGYAGRLAADTPDLRGFGGSTELDSVSA